MNVYAAHGVTGLTGESADHSTISMEQAESETIQSFSAITLPG